MSYNISVRVGDKRTEISVSAIWVPSAENSYSVAKRGFGRVFSAGFTIRRSRLIPKTMEILQEKKLFDCREF